MQSLNEERDFNRLLMNNFGKMIVVTFYADWYEHSVDYLSQFQSLSELTPLSTETIFVKCDAEKVEAVANKFGISQVPTIIVTESRSQSLLKLENVPAASAFTQIEEYSKVFSNNFKAEETQMRSKVKEMLEQPGVLMFIKGTPQEPECKFTRQLLEIINGLGIKYRYYDIIADAEMRHWLRYISKWPTYPQIFFDGKLLGGLDVLKEKIAKNELVLPASAKQSDPEQRLKLILQENKTVLLSEGDDNQAAVAALEILRNNGIKFNLFNLQIDQNLKGYLTSNADTVPPVFYADGKLVGNLQVLKELASKGELLQKVPGSEWKLDGEQKLKYLLKTCPLLLFMQGTPKEPQVESSKAAVEVLNATKVSFEFFNVDADADLKSALKGLSNFDQLPQLYSQGELIGGVDVLNKLSKDGDLNILLKAYIKE